MQKEKNKKIIEKIYNWLYKDVSIIAGINSMLLITLCIIFINFFIVGVHLSLFKTYFEILVIFGILIIIFCVTPTYFKGFFAITNLLLLVGGIVWIINENSFWMFGALRLNIFFILLFLACETLSYLHENKEKKVVRRKARRRRIWR